MSCASKRATSKYSRDGRAKQSAVENISSYWAEQPLHNNNLPSGVAKDSLDYDVNNCTQNDYYANKISVNDESTNNKPQTSNEIELETNESISQFCCEETNLYLTRSSTKSDKNSTESDVYDTYNGRQHEELKKNFENTRQFYNENNSIETHHNKEVSVALNQSHSYSESETPLQKPYLERETFQDDGRIWNIATPDNVIEALDAMLEGSVTPTEVNITLKELDAMPLFKDLWYILVRRKCRIRIFTGDFSDFGHEVTDGNKDLLHWMLDGFNYSKTMCTLEYWGKLDLADVDLLPRCVTHLGLMLCGPDDIVAYGALLKRISSSMSLRELHVQVSKDFQADCLKDRSYKIHKDVGTRFYFSGLRDKDVDRAVEMLSHLNNQHNNTKSLLILPKSTLSVTGIQNLFISLKPNEKSLWKYNVFAETDSVHTVTKKELEKEFKQYGGFIAFNLDISQCDHKPHYCWCEEIPTFKKELNTSCYNGHCEEEPEEDVQSTSAMETSRRFSEQMEEAASEDNPSEPD